MECATGGSVSGEALNTGAVFSELTVGDFWGGRSVLPEMDPDLGVSAIIASTQKGHDLFSTCAESFVYAESDFETMAKENPNLLHPTLKTADTDLFWQTYANGGFSAVERLHRRTHIVSVLKGKIKRMLPMACIKAIRKLRGTR